ncbi:MAG: hypothetical protein ABJG68_15575 [Crocinitomicaceae bacterium]
MILLIIVASLFYRSAKKRALNGALWGFLAVLTWFGSQVIAGVIIGLSNPMLLDSDAALTMWGLVASIAGSIGLFVLLEMTAKKKSNKVKAISDDIMDDGDFDNL